MPTNSDKIDALFKTTSALEENLRANQRDTDDIKRDVHEAEGRVHQLDMQIARIEEALKHNTAKLGKLDPTDRLIRVEEGLKNITKELINYARIALKSGR